MNRRSFLQLLGLAPAAAVVAKEAVAQSVPEKLAGFDDRGQGNVERAQQTAEPPVWMLRDFDDVPLHSPDHEHSVYLTDAEAVSFSRDRADPRYPRPIGTVISVDRDGPGYGYAWVRIGSETDRAEPGDDA